MKFSVTCIVPTSTLTEIGLSQFKGVAKVVLKRGKTQLFKNGSPMVYSGAVDRIIGRPPPKTGDVVVVADGTERPIAWGMYNSTSMFQVRIMQLEEELSRDPSCALNMEKLLQSRIASALDLRKRLNLPSLATNAYRLVNSEGDRLSGLIVDIFGDLAVVASSAAWVESYKSTIEAAITSIDPIKRVNWRPSYDMLKEEGLQLQAPDPTLSHQPENIKVTENGVQFIISPNGQKTGFYADQRENRRFISSISEGKTVLDLCCYTGGFSLNAAVGGAVRVTGVDTSAPAIDLAKENAILNEIPSGKLSFVKEDVSEYLKGAIRRGEAWDIVILDPPKLAPRRKDMPKAVAMYRKLNALAMRVTERGGMLMTCSCSGAMTQSGKFSSLVQEAAVMSGRRIAVVREAGAACDHPVDTCYPEGTYLTNLLVRVM